MCRQIVRCCCSSPLHAPGLACAHSLLHPHLHPPTHPPTTPPFCCRHLDADEAVVLGAGLFAANLSTTFRLRQFGMADKVPYSVSIQLDSESGGRWTGGRACL